MEYLAVLVVAAGIVNVLVYFVLKRLPFVRLLSSRTPAVASVLLGLLVPILSIVIVVAIAAILEVTFVFLGILMTAVIIVAPLVGVVSFIVIILRGVLNSGNAKN